MEVNIRFRTRVVNRSKFLPYVVVILLFLLICCFVGISLYIFFVVPPSPDLTTPTAIESPGVIDADTPNSTGIGIPIFTTCHTVSESTSGSSTVVTTDTTQGGWGP